jgi:hypothetical protein
VTSRRPLRVVHCPVNTAGIPWTNVQALRQRGVDASLVVFNRYTLHPEADRSLELEGGLVRRQLAQWKVLAELLPRTDLFHFTFGLTLVPQSLQFPILRALRKRSVMQYLGSDIRGKTPEELAYGRKAGAEIVGSYDAIRWVPHATVIPPGIDLARVTPAQPSGRRRPVVVHACQDHHHPASIFQNAIPTLTRRPGRTDGAVVYDSPLVAMRVRPKPVPTMMFRLGPSSQL